jgi:choline monooxygenase
MIDPFTLPDFTDEDLEILPLERSQTIPSRWYTDRRFHELDNEVILGRSWQYIGHVRQVQNPGDQCTGSVAGNPIIVVRGEDDKLRAFYNVCRHRGGPLAVVKGGKSQVLQCRYHGWTYLLDGSLRGTPRFNRVDLFDRKDYGLIPVRLDAWEGLVFVNLGDTGQSLSALFNGIVGRIAPMTLTNKKFYRRVTYNVNCNWKVYIDNYLEGYHLPFVHPELCTLLDLQNYASETFEYYSLQTSPISQKDSVYISKDGQAFYYFVWPNFMMNILPGRLQTNLVVPVSCNNCVVIFDYYYDDISTDEAINGIEGDIRYSDKVQHEDMEICEQVQKGLESRAYDKGRFSVECEGGVYHFQSLLKKAYRSALLK